MVALVAVAIAVVGGCSSHISKSAHSASTVPSAVSTGPASGGAPDGLVTFLDRQGIEVADPVSGQVRLVVAIPSPELGTSGNGRYLVDGPVWGREPGVTHPVIYFALSGLSGEPHEGDVFYRADPFTGGLSVLAGVPDPTSQTEDLAALPGELLYTSGCCEDIGINGLRLDSAQVVTVETSIGGMWVSLGGTFDGQLAATHSIVGPTGLFQSREYLWVNPAGPSTSPLPVPSGFSSGQASIASMAIDSTGTIEALAVYAGQAGVESLDIYDTLTGALTPQRSSAGQLGGLAFAPSGPWLAVSAGGSLSVLDAQDINGTTNPTADPYHLSVVGTGVQGVSWSPAISGIAFARVVEATESVGSLFQQESAALTPQTSPTSAPVTTTTTIPSVPTSDGIANLYVLTGAEPGTLYQWKQYPGTIQYDNHDYFGGLTWSTGPNGLVGSGYLAYDKCNPNCAVGTFQLYPVTIRASQSRECTINVYSTALGATTTEHSDVWVDPTAEFAASKPPLDIPSVDDTWPPSAC